jgi:hypothetical protein
MKFKAYLSLDIVAQIRAIVRYSKPRTYSEDDQFITQIYIFHSEATIPSSTSFGAEPQMLRQEGDEELSCGCAWNAAGCWSSL